MFLYGRIWRQRHVRQNNRKAVLKQNIPMSISEEALLQNKFVCSCFWKFVSLIITHRCKPLTEYPFSSWAFMCDPWATRRATTWGYPFLAAYISGVICFLKEKWMSEKNISRYQNPMALSSRAPQFCKDSLFHRRTEQRTKPQDTTFTLQHRVNVTEHTDSATHLHPVSNF